MLIDNKWLLKTKGVLRKRAPFVFVIGSRLAAKTVLFRNERKFISGKLETDCELPSVLFFTSIRTASQFIDGVISRLYSEAGGLPLNLPKYYFHAQPSGLAELRDEAVARRVLKPRGFYFGPIRPFGFLPDPDTYRSVVVVRDPRDVMVSFFHSLAYAHTPSDAKFIRDAREAREMGIEKFVRQPERIEMVRGPLDFYRREAWGKEGVFSWRYEDMMEDFPSFARGLDEHITGGRSGAVLDQLIEEKAEQDKKFQGGNQLSHRRSGRAGQFREALSQETCEFLAEEFRHSIEAFGYEK